MTFNRFFYNIRHVATTALAEPAADPPIGAGSLSLPLPGRRERRVAETRRAIAAAAKSLFEEHGYSETTIDQIAERADVATRTLFRYFPSKEALLFADFDEWRCALLTELEARPTDEPPLCSVAFALSKVVAVAEGLRPQIDRAMRLAEEHDAVATYQRGVLKTESAEAVADYIARKLAVDRSRDPRPEAWAGMMLSAFGTALKACNDPTAPPEADPIDALAQLLADTADAVRAASETLRARPA